MKKSSIRWHRLGVSVGGSLAIGAMTLLGASAPAVAAPRLSDSLSNANGFVGVSEVAYSDGTVTDTFRNAAGAPVNVTGPRGMVVDIGPVVAQGSSGKVFYSQSVGARPPALDKSTPGAADRAIAAYEAAGRSVMNDAIHNGMDAAAAKQMLAPSGSVLNAAAAEVRLSAPNATAGGTIIMSWCTSAKSSDGKVNGHACDVQKMDQDNGGGDWYVMDEQTASGWSTDTNWFPERLTQLAQWVAYPGGNTIVNWKPSGTQTIGNCTSVTSGINDPKTGLTFTATSTICPNTFGPYTITGTQFGTTWKGQEPSANYYEGSEAVDEVHSPPSASDSPYLYVHIWW